MYLRANIQKQINSKVRNFKKPKILKTMGLFDKIFSSNKTEFKYSPLTEQEAWVAVIYGCMAVDGEVSDSEIDKFVNLISFKQQFINFNIVDLYRTAAFAHRQIGSKGLIESSASKISNDYKPTVFAIVMELLLADGILQNKEQEIAEYLSDALQLQADLAQKIVEVILIKMKGNIMID